MSITVRNNHPGKTLSFGKGVNIHPQVNIITDVTKITHLRANRKSFEKYFKAFLPGTRTHILELVSGKLDDLVIGEKGYKDPTKATGGKGNKGNKNPSKVNLSTLANHGEMEAIDIVDMTLDIASLENILATETREAVRAKAQEKLDLVRS